MHMNAVKSIDVPHQAQFQFERTSYRSSANTLLVLNRSNRIIYCSENASEFLGLHTEEVVGQLIDEILRPQVPDGSADEFFQGLSDIIEGAESASQSSELVAPWLEPSTLKVSAHAIVPGPGEQIIVLIFENISDDDQSSKKLNSARQWNSAIAILAHELNNPLTVIMAYSNLLLNDTALSPTQREWLRNIVSSSEQITDIGSTLGSAARIDPADVHTSLECLGVKQAVDRAAAMIAFIDAGHSFAAEIEAEIPSVMANPFRFNQVMKNLLENAVKYSPQGGRISVAAWHDPENRRVVFKVEDQGIGIASEDQDRIFSPNVRITRAETEGIRGVGLGLFIVKELVEMMGGEIWVESELNRGSAFHFTLPVSD